MTTTQSGIRLAKRMEGVVFSDLVVIRNRIMNMQLEGIKVYALHGGEPFYDTPDPIKYAAIKALFEGKTRYTDSSGRPRRSSRSARSDWRRWRSPRCTGRRSPASGWSARRATAPPKPPQSNGPSTG